MAKKLYRIPQKGKLAGVAAGFAEYLEMDVTFVRVLFVAALFASFGTALLVYIVLAIVLPTPGADKDQPLDIGDRVEVLTEELKTSGRAENAGNYVGIGLIALGAWLLIGQIFPGWFSMQWNLIWPSLVIVLGVWILVKGGKQNGKS